MEIETNTLIIGSGIAGLTFAVKMAEKSPKKQITIVTKGDEDESNTKYAQGGVAVVLDLEEDSFQKHIQDTLIAGDGLCDKSVVETVIKQGPKRLKELIDWGANFDINSDGNLDLGREGGHSEYRVIHYKDMTGLEIERALLNRVHQLKNITVLSHHFAIDLVTEDHLKTKTTKNLRCFGAYVLNQKTNQVITIQAENTLLASGGIGRVYGHTTNPVIATGDGIAMAYRAKAKIKDMEFVQFHPTALHHAKSGASFLISEAVRGFGAILRNKNGHRFMPNYDERAELASRDIVSQSIDSELKKSGDSCVYLDCTHLNLIEFKQYFPNIYNTCLEHQIDITVDWIPVVPASHYLCGGILVDEHGKTSIENLFASGECSRTGLHGANRLASNSLLEALVYSHAIFKHIISKPTAIHTPKIQKWNDSKTPIINEHYLIQHNLNKLQRLMRDYAGIIRSNNCLQKATSNLDSIYKEVEILYKHTKVTTTLCELRNMVNIAHLIISQSIVRKENKGGFFNSNNV